MRATAVRTLILCLGLGFAPMAATPAGAGASQNFLSLSYGEVKDARQAPGGAWRMKVEAARARYEEFAARAEATFRAQQLTRVPRAPATLMSGAPEALAAALDDPTLRYNDMIVADDGVLIFRGAAGARRSAADFERLSDARMRALSLRTMGASR